MFDDRLVGTEGFVNGGVQFRSRRIADPAHEMSGFQADIGAGFSGCLYDESRRNRMLVMADTNLVRTLERPGDWNRYEIRAVGPQIAERLTYVRGAFGNSAGAVDPAAVARVRAATATRQAPWTAAELGATR